MAVNSIRAMEKLGKLGSRFWPQIGLLALLAGLASPALARPLQLVSVPNPAQRPPAGGGGDSYDPIISPDGRYVLFASTANNLVLTSNNAPIPLNVPPTLNVFLRDRTNQATTLVSVNLSGAAGGNGDSWPYGVSADGRYALFESSASDLVVDDTNGVADAFVRDLAAGTTLLVSVSTNGGSANGASRNPVMTPEGRYVAFVSDAILIPHADAIADQRLLGLLRWHDELPLGENGLQFLIPLAPHHLVDFRKLVTLVMPAILPGSLLPLLQRRLFQLGLHFENSLLKESPPERSEHEFWHRHPLKHPDAEERKHRGAYREGRCLIAGRRVGAGPSIWN